jgi:hypothetical protein
MNSQTEVWRQQQYASNVYHLSQQEGSIIAPIARKEIFVGKAEFFDRLGQAVAQDKVSRNSDTPNLNIDHTRRMVVTVTREWGTLVDRKDKLQNIHSMEHEYAKAAQMGIGRKMDNVFIDKAFGVALTGEDGSTSTVLPNVQKVTAVASAALAYPNILFLRKTALRLNQQKVKGKRVIYHASDFLDALLGETTVTSADYNSVKALVNGDLKSFMGFEFQLCEELASYTATSNGWDSSTYKFDTATGLYSASGTALGGTEKVALCVVEGGLIHGETQGSMLARIDERSDKGYSGQVYASIDMGAVRFEDEKIIQMIYKA